MPDTTTRYRITAYRCQCCPGIRYRKAADGFWWATTDVKDVTIHGQARYNLDELRAGHEGVTADTVDNLQALLDEHSAAEATIARVKALAAWAGKPWTGEELDTTDGTILYVNDNAVWVRSDSLNTTRTDGDWYPLDNTGDKSASSIAEVLGFDQPPQDRNIKRFEALITVDDLRKTITGEA